MSRAPRGRGLAAASVAAFAAAAFFAWLFRLRYWIWRGEFSTEGRAYDPVSGDVYVEQAGCIWGALMALFLVAGLLLALSARRARRRSGA